MSVSYWDKPTPYLNHDAVTSLGHSQNNFTRDLYSYLARGSEGNLFFSPFSVMTALGMTYAGAGGKTQEQMRSVLHLTNQEIQNIHKAFCDVLTEIKGGVSHYELRTSNNAYIYKDLEVLPEYSKILTEKFLTSCELVDFKEGEVVRHKINSQVEKDTNSLIKNIIPSGVLDELTRMVLVNALYFKAEWFNKFNEGKTRDRDFWVTPKDRRSTPMMCMTEYLGYKHVKDLGAKVLSMKYKGSTVSMIIVLPDKYDGLSEMETKMSTMDISELFVTEVQNVEATIPKFKLEESLQLSKILKGMGITDLFDMGKCDLTGISKAEDLVVSEVIHKAFLKVNEDGTEAAAATAVVAMFGSAFGMKPPEPVKFIADHPFSFFIRDNRSGMILFSGRLTKL